MTVIRFLVDENFEHHPQIDIDTIAGASHADELRDRVEHLPLSATYPRRRRVTSMLTRKPYELT